MQIPEHLLTVEQVEANLTFEKVYYNVRRFAAAQQAFIWSLKQGFIVLDGDDGLFWSCPKYVAAELVQQGYTVATIMQDYLTKEGLSWPGLRSA